MASRFIPSINLPPVNAFWSVTVYDDRQLLAPSKRNRFTIGDRDPLTKNADGSIDLWVQSAGPGADKAANWLPLAPEGRFTVMMRLYWPKTPALDGRWQPPPVTPVEEHSPATNRRRSRERRPAALLSADLHPRAAPSGTTNYWAISRQRRSRTKPPAVRSRRPSIRDRTPCPTRRLAAMPNPHPDILHRFTLVRPFTACSEEALHRRFVMLDQSLTLAQQRVASQTDGVVRRFIRDDKPGLADALGFLATNGRLLARFDDLVNRFPRFDLVYRAYLADRRTFDLNKLTQGLQAVLGAFNSTNNTQYNTVADYLNEPNDVFFQRKLLLWDNMLAYYLNSSREPDVRQRVMELIRMFWIMERLVAPQPNPANGLWSLTDADLSEAFEATIVLPEKHPVAAPPPQPAPPDNPPRDDREAIERERERMRERMAAIAAAVHEISTEHDNQTVRSMEPGCDRDDNRGANPNILMRRYVGNLSERTHVLLDELKMPKDVFHVPTAINRLQAELRKAVPLPSMATFAARVMTVGASNFTVGNAVATAAKRGALAIDFSKFGNLGASPFGPGTPTMDSVAKEVRFGAADLKVVEMKLLKYEMGEVAHIEALLAGETKERVFRVLNRVEETIVSEQETSTFSERDSQTTDRFELNQEIARQEQESLQFEAGLAVTADLGTVSIAAHADFSYSSSKDSSNKIASRQARETVARAVTRVSEATKTQRTIRTIKESEETNTHRLTNAGANNLSGIYRWVDKYYLAELRNYGLRWMLEFIVPEPAAFYIHAATHRKSEGLVVEKPEYPRIWMPYDPDIDDAGYRDVRSFHDIKTEEEHPHESYDKLAAKYGATVEQPPPKFLKLARSIVSPSPAEGGEKDSKLHPKTFVLKAEKDAPLTIPDGYVANWATVRLVYDKVDVGGDDDDIQPRVEGFLGNLKITDSEIQNFSQAQIGGEVGEIPFVLHAHVHEFACNIEIGCDLTERRLDQWRLATYSAIMAAYNQRLAEYNEWLRNLESQAAMEIAISGQNPGRNREVEKEELKRLAIEALTEQRFESFDAMRHSPKVPDDAPHYGYPDFSFTDAREEGRFIQFFEQAFDWRLMTYKFYPYYWGNKDRWVLAKSFKDTDPVFASFLQAGAARVVVPIKAGDQYRVMVEHYLATGRIWNGGDAPSPGDQIWLSIADELKDDAEKGRVDDQWIVKLPTELVMLEQVGAPLPSNVVAMTPTLLDDVKRELGLP